MIAAIPVVPCYECVTPEELLHFRKGAALAFAELERRSVPLTDDERAWYNVEAARER